MIMRKMIMKMVNRSMLQLYHKYRGMLCLLYIVSIDDVIEATLGFLQSIWSAGDLFSSVVL